LAWGGSFSGRPGLVAKARLVRFCPGSNGRCTIVGGWIAALARHSWFLAAARRYDWAAIGRSMPGSEPDDGRMLGALIADVRLWFQTAAVLLHFD